MHARTFGVLLAAAALTGAGTGGCWNTAGVGKDRTPAEFNKASGELHASVDRTLEECFDASRKAMDDMGYHIFVDAKDALHGIVKAHEADGGIIKVNSWSKAERVTTIEVDVGTFGSEAKARMIMDKILGRLGH